MPRVQGDTTSWKKHTPDTPGVACCAPQVVGQSDFAFPQISLAAGQQSVVVQLAAGQCGVDEPLQGVIYADPFGPGNPIPTINSVTLVPGNPNLINVDFDTSLVPPAAGNFLLELTNNCGCCTLVTGTVI